MKEIIVCILFLSFSIKIQAQDLLRLAPQIYDAYETLDDAFGKVKSVQIIVKQIEEGKEPDVSSFGESELNALTNFYKRAAQKIVQAPLITDFDSKPYSVSTEEMLNCYLRNQNFTRLHQYQSALDQAINLGQQQLKKMQEFKVLIDSNFVALKYLKDIHARLVLIPIYRQIFQWNWFELETGTSKALAYLESGVKAHSKKLQQEVEKVRLQGTNLKNNIAQLESNLCNPAGNYRGQCAWANIANHELVIVTHSNRYNGSLTTRNNSGVKVWDAPIIDITGDKIQFFGYYNGYKKLFVGHMNSTYTVISEFRATDEPGSCSVTK